VKIILLTSVLIAVIVNILANIWFMSPLYTVAGIGVTVLLASFVMIKLEQIKTEITEDVEITLIYDPEKGEFNRYPDLYEPQNLARQAFEALSKRDSSIKEGLKVVPKPDNQEIPFFTHLAEYIILQILSYKTSEAEYEFFRSFKKFSFEDLPQDLKYNPVISGLSSLKNPTDIVERALVNNINTLYMPIDARLRVEKHSLYTTSDARSLVLEGEMYRISIEYHTSLMWPISSLQTGPLPQLGVIPISEYYLDDAMKRLGRLRYVSYHLRMKSELKRKTMYLLLMLLEPFFTMILKRPVTRSVQLHLDFMDKIIRSSKRDADFDAYIANERLKNRDKYIIDTLFTIKNSLDDVKAMLSKK
jgi:hypothetical protein